MALNHIKIGDTFERVYQFYNPLLDDDGNPVLDSRTRRPSPDYDSPLNLTGIAVRFVVQNQTNAYSFTGSKVVVTPLEGKVAVKLAPTDTAQFTESTSGKSSSYLVFTEADADEYTKAVLAEKIEKRAKS